MSSTLLHRLAVHVFNFNLHQINTLTHSNKISVTLRQMAMAKEARFMWDWWISVCIILNVSRYFNFRTLPQSSRHWSFSFFINFLKSYHLRYILSIRERLQFIRKDILVQNDKGRFIFWGLEYSKKRFFFFFVKPQVM